MKKKLIFGMIMILFLVLPMGVKADNAVCIFRKRSMPNVHAAIHIVNGKPLVDVYAEQTSFNKIWQLVSNWAYEADSDELEIRYNSIVKDELGNHVGVDASHYFMSENCPEVTFCEDKRKEQVWLIDKGKNCDGTEAFDFIQQMTESEVSNLDVELAFSFKGGKGAINYKSIILGSCPSDVDAFKLLGIGYGLLKIIAPILLVVFATIDIAKAVASSDESKMRKAQQIAMKRVVAAVIVFLSFVVIDLIIGLVSNSSATMECIEQIIK